MTRVDLPWTSPPLTGNRSRNNEHAYAAKMRQAQAEARWAIKVADLEPLDGANVTLHWLIPNRIRRDSDNLGSTLKPTLDALVLEGVLPDDSWVHVRRTSCEIHPPNGEPAAMWLTLDPLEA